MDTSSRYDTVLALGRKLVGQLGIEGSVDTLGRWMAHYVAELIDAAENAPGEERREARGRCFEAILNLWSHRSELPDGKRPFESIEPVVRAMESLDPESSTARYFRSVRDEVVEGEEGEETQSLLEFVHSIDSTARILIAHTLAEAARSAIDRSRSWVAMAEAAGTDPGVIDLVIRVGSDDWSSNPNTGREERDRFQERIDRLSTFVEMVGPVADELKKRRDAVE